MNFEYDFKFELSKCLKKCIENLYDSKQYFSISSIRKMEKVDKMLDNKKITQEKHKLMCEEIKLSNQKYLKELLGLLSDIIAHKTRTDFNETNYDMVDELIRVNLKYDKTLINVLREVNKIICNLT